MGASGNYSETIGHKHMKHGTIDRCPGMSVEIELLMSFSQTNFTEVVFLNNGGEQN